MRAERLLDLHEALRPQAGHELGTWQFVPVLAPDHGTREAILAAAEGRVELRTYYHPLHLTQAFGSADRGDLAVTEAISERILCLPMAEDLDGREIDAIARVVREGRDAGARAAA